MDLRSLVAPTIIAACLTATTPALAAVVLEDDFDASGPSGLNWGGDSAFTSTSAPGSVDLIGNGFFDFYPGQGLYVDLDGSTGFGNDPAGELTSLAAFGPGSYELTFLLGGNARGWEDRTTRVSLGDFSVDISLASDAGLQAFSYTFTTLTGGNLVFTELGPSNQRGSILDAITLSTIPEPSTWAMMILGFGGAGALVRRRQRGLPMAFA
jgi:PEP-CTERM motif